MSAEKLQTAIRRSNVKDVQIQLRKGVSIVDPFPHGYTPLRYAVLIGTSSRYANGKPKETYEVIKTLIDAGADANEVGILNDLRSYSIDAHKVLHLLIENGCNQINRQEETNDYFRGYTPVMMNYKNYNMLSAMIDAGADLNIKQHEGLTVLLRLSMSISECRPYGGCIRKNFTPNFELLIKSGVNINAVDNKGTTSLMHLLGSYETQRFIRKANLDAIFEAVKLLVDAGADLNIQDPCGNTALMFACRSTDMEIVKYLLESGSNPYIKNMAGQTAMNMVKTKMMSEYKKLVRCYEEKIKLIKDTIIDVVRIPEDLILHEVFRFIGYSNQVLCNTYKRPAKK